MEEEIKYDAALVVEGALDPCFIVGRSLVGTIFEDSKHRFLNGERITTSTVTSFVYTAQGLMAITRNSTYKVVVL